MAEKAFALVLGACVSGAAEGWAVEEGVPLEVPSLSYTDRAWEVRVVDVKYTQQNYFINSCKRELFGSQTVNITQKKLLTNYIS